MQHLRVHRSTFKCSVGLCQQLLPRLVTSNAVRFASTPAETSVDFSKLTRKWEDVKIPVPWGHIAGRWWGPRDKQPILTMHGWLENSSSWDPFMNMVPEDEPMSFLTIDMPGNGLSSHYYQNSWYHASEDMMALRLLLKHYQWKEPVTFLCHSYSTGHAFLYTAAFPKDVKKIVTVDLIKPMGITMSNWTKTGGASLDRVIDFMTNYKPKAKSLQQHAEEYHKATFKSITVEGAKYLMSRNMRVSAHDPELFTNGRDPRQTIDFYFSFPQEFLLEMAKRITCDFYTIKALNSLPFEHPKYAAEVEAVLRHSTKTFERVEVNGTHHVHMLHPERVYEPIMRWLRKH